MSAMTTVSALDAEQIETARSLGVLAVEMEASALYAFAQARARPVICFAHVTNQMAQSDGDFEKGEASGTRDAFSVIAAASRAWRKKHEA
jgi:uridine phosphorylase